MMAQDETPEDTREEAFFFDGWDFVPVEHDEPAPRKQGDSPPAPTQS